MSLFCTDGNKARLITGEEEEIKHLSLNATDHQEMGNCYMMELDPIYVDVIINRWQDFTGSKATLESTGQTYDEMKGERLASD